MAAHVDYGGALLRLDNTGNRRRRFGLHRMGGPVCVLCLCVGIRVAIRLKSGIMGSMVEDDYLL